MLNPFGDVRRAERRHTYAAFLVLFGIMAGHALLETARDALFLASMAPARLAWVYLSIAVLSLGFFVGQRGQAGSQNPLRLAVWLVGAAGVNVLFWFLVARPNAPVLYALYTWSGLLATLLVVRFWTLVGDVFGTVGEAKRLYGPIVAGSVLGAIFGSSIARLVTGLASPRQLLLAAAAIFVLTAVGPVLLLRRPQPEAPHTGDDGTRRLDWRRQLGALYSRPFLRRVGALVLLSTLTLTLVDFLFKSAVVQHVAPPRYGAFFATAYLFLNVFSSVVQLFVVNRVLRTSPIHRVHAVLPALVLAGITALLAGGGLVAALLVKAFDGVLRHSLHRTATEVLFVPFSGELRLRLRGLFDALGQRGGQVVAALCILAAGFLGPREPILGLLVLFLASLWLYVALTLETYYLGIFRDTLREFTTPRRFDFPELDLASLETLLAALNSDNDEEVKAALDVLAAQERTHVIPALILYHPSASVVIKALELFAAAGRQDILGILERRLVEHEDPEVRSAALRTHAWVGGPNAALCRRAMGDASPAVRATALIGLVSYAPPLEAAQARISLERLAASGTPEEKLALAGAIRYSPGAGYERILMQLAETSHGRVRLAVARAMREIRSPRFIPKLLDMLPSRALREEARATLVSIGSQGLESLEAALADPRLEMEIRLRVPRTIALFPPERAAPILLQQLDLETSGALRFRILRALGRLRSRHPHLPLDEAILQRALESNLTNVFQLLDWRRNLLEAARREERRATPVQQLIVSLLEHRQALAMERLFRLVGLLCPGEDVRSLYRGWRNPSRTTRDSTRELLQHLLRPPLRDPILALVDEGDDAEKLARAGPYHRVARLEYETLLESLLQQGSVGMRCLVAYHVGEMRLHALRDTLLALPADPAGLVTRAVERTLALLADSGQKVADGR